MHPRVVLLNGVKEFLLEITATNPIGKKYKDLTIIRVAPDPEARKRILALQRELARLQKQASPDTIRARQFLIKQTFYQALRNPYLEVWHNDQVVPVFTLESECKTRTRGFDADSYLWPRTSELVSKSDRYGEDRHSVTMKRIAAGTYLSDKPVKDYWITKGSYSGQIYKWDPDGLLGGDGGGTLTSRFQCCEDEIPVFGVELIIQNCVVVKKKDTIPMRAEVKPTWLDKKIEYRFSVVAKPDREAKPIIIPDGWSPSPDARLQADRSGSYTLRTECRVDNRACSLTHSLADILVIQPGVDRLT